MDRRTEFSKALDYCSIVELPLKFDGAWVGGGASISYITVIRKGVRHV